MSNPKSQVFGILKTMVRHPSTCKIEFHGTSWTYIMSRPPACLEMKHRKGSCSCHTSALWQMLRLYYPLEFPQASTSLWLIAATQSGVLWLGWTRLGIFFSKAMHSTTLVPHGTQYSTSMYFSYLLMPFPDFNIPPVPRSKSPGKRGFWEVPHGFAMARISPILFTATPNMIKHARKVHIAALSCTWDEPRSIKLFTEELPSGHIKDSIVLVSYSKSFAGLELSTFNVYHFLS